MPSGPAERSDRLFSVLRRDFSRYYPPGQRLSVVGKMRVFLDTPGMQAVLVYRFGNWLNRRIRIRIIRLPLAFVHYVLDKLCVICWGIAIDSRANIGPGLYIGHFGGVIVGPVTMGADCNISQQVTIGLRADGQPGVPTLGDRVWIGVGSVIYGNIHIGNGVSIAPLSVISRSLPDRVMVAGNPMRVLAKDHDNHQAIFGRPREGATTPCPADPESPILP